MSHYLSISRASRCTWPWWFACSRRSTEHQHGDSERDPGVEGRLYGWRTQVLYDGSRKPSDHRRPVSRTWSVAWLCLTRTFTLRVIWQKIEICIWSLAGICCINRQGISRVLFVIKYIVSNDWDRKYWSILIKPVCSDQIVHSVQ